MGKATQKKITEARKLASPKGNRWKPDELIKLERDQALDILARIATGDLKETKQTAAGEVFEQEPHAKDKKDAIALIAKIEGWVGEDGKKGQESVKVAILKPAPKVEG